MVNVGGIATIASGQSLSGVVDLGEIPLVAIQMPAGWDAANITFQASYDGTNFFNLVDGSGNEVTVTNPVANRYIMIRAFYDFFGVRFFKVRSGTSAVPVNQTAQRQIILITNPYAES